MTPSASLTSLSAQCDLSFILPDNIQYITLSHFSNDTGYSPHNHNIQNGITILPKDLDFLELDIITDNVLKYLPKVTHLKGNFDTCVLPEVTVLTITDVQQSVVVHQL